MVGRRDVESGDAEAAVSALINATIFEHPALFNLCTSIPRLGIG